MREPAPDAVQQALQACQGLAADAVLTSGAWATLREHCADLVVELDLLGRGSIARRVDRDYARLHGEVRSRLGATATQRSELNLRDAVLELASTLAAIQRFRTQIDSAAGDGPALDDRQKPAAEIGGPVADPHDTRKAVWFGKRIFLGGDTQVRRLFWLLAHPLGAVHSLGDVQRAVDGMETDRADDAEEARKAEQRVRKAVSKLRDRLREAELDIHVSLVREGPRDAPEYSMVLRFHG